MSSGPDDRQNEATEAVGPSPASHPPLPHPDPVPDTSGPVVSKRDRASGAARRHARISELVVVAVVAAILGGGIVGFIDRHAARPAARPVVDTLSQPTPPPGNQPPGPITVIARQVLPSVVELSGSEGAGSGVVLSANGLILTNAHVLQAGGTGGLNATFQNGNTALVRVIGIDTPADLAVVQAQGVSGLTPIQLGNSDGLEVGQQVVAIGAPLGLTGTVTSGIISALNRPVIAAQPPDPSQSGPGGLGGTGLLPSQPPPAPAAPALDAIQTDAAINPGNSGGPLVDLQGRIIGLNAALASLGGLFSGSQGSIGLGFSIPINQAKRIADELVATGHANQARLGVTARDSSPSGAQLLTVQPGSAAAKAGLLPGDIISKIGDQLITDSEALQAATNSATPGSTVTVTLTSGAGAAHTTKVTLDSVPAT
jgi:putative serine protease PepD